MICCKFVSPMTQVCTIMQKPYRWWHFLTQIHQKSLQLTSQQMANPSLKYSNPELSFILYEYVFITKTVQYNMSLCHKFMYCSFLISSYMWYSSKYFLWMILANVGCIIIFLMLILLFKGIGLQEVMTSILKRQTTFYHSYGLKITKQK